MASVAFQKAIAKKKNAAQLMKSANEAESGGDFSAPEIDDGAYIFRVSATCGMTTNKNVPFVELKWKIEDDSPFNGKGWNKTHYLENDDPDKEEKAWARLGKDLKTLTGEEIDLSSGEDIDRIVDQINQSNPLVKGRIKNTEQDGKTYLNIYFNELLDYEVEVTYSKGDSVIYDGEEYTVSSVNPRDKTASLSGVTGKKSNISWSDLLLNS